MDKAAAFCEQLAFDRSGLIPAIIIDSHDRSVLMLGWMNKESIAETLEEKAGGVL